jgi:hypothetical protein
MCTIEVSRNSPRMSCYYSRYEHTPLLIGDATYLICTYLQKNWKTYNPTNVDKIGYDSNMNSKRVVIENAFGSLKTF